MNIGRAITIVAALAQAAHAEQKVDVFIYGGESIPFATLQRAKALASGMFAKADVRIAWHGVARSEWKGGNRVLIIQMEMNTPKSFPPDAIGRSLPFEGVHVSIFYDRIRQMNRERLPTLLLAHAMVHEITHMLQGVERHSATGVMKAHWDWDDYMLMERQPLPFTPEDIQMIRKAESRPAIIAAKIP
jgi:hypothetical protein